MATGLSAANANAALDAIRTDTPFMQLHVGDPGAAGTANVATETTRKAVTFGAASASSMANTVAVTWTSIAGSQDATHFSIWDASTAGNFLCSGTITANAYTAGDTYEAAIGAITVSITGAS
jgi:hypothetical protein